LGYDIILVGFNYQMDLTMEAVTFKKAAIKLRETTSEGDFTFGFEENEIKESFYDSFYESMQESGEGRAPEDMTAQAKAMVDALEFRLVEVGVEYDNDETDMFSPISGHYTVPGNVSYHFESDIIISKKEGATIELDDNLIDLAADDYIDCYCTVEAEYSNDNTVEANKAKKALEQQKLTQPAIKEQMPEEYSKPKLTP